MRRIVAAFVILLVAGCSQPYISREQAIKIAVDFGTHSGFGPAYSGSGEPKVVGADLMTYAAATESIGESNHAHPAEMMVWLVTLEGTWGPEFHSGPPTAAAPPVDAPPPFTPAPWIARQFRIMLDGTTGQFISISYKE